MRIFILIGLVFSFFSCVNVPKEAPQLSHDLGIQLQELESSHLALIQNFFDGKRKEVRAFIDDDWAPLFADNFFNQPAIAQAWNEIVASDDKEARLEFITLVAPEIVFQTEKAYQKIIEPMEELESHLVRAIHNKYDYSFEMNRTLSISRRLPQINVSIISRPLNPEYFPQIPQITADQFSIISRPPNPDHRTLTTEPRPPNPDH